jgi:hypothetical protein
MRPSLTLLLVVAINTGATAQTHHPLTMATVEGRYEGELLNRGRFRPVGTHLKFGSDSSWSGYYEFFDVDRKQASGELTDCKATAPLELACQWHDPFGTGRVVFTFAPDLRSFKGRWSPSSQPQSWFPWSGSKQE